MKIKLTLPLATKLLALLDRSVTDPEVAELVYMIEQRMNRAFLREERA